MALPMSDAEHEIMQARRAKRDALIAQKQNPYANGYVPKHTAAVVEAAHADEPREPKPVDTSITYTLAGRVMFMRSFGKAAFIKIQDQTGQVQVYCKKDQLPPEQYEAFLQVDMGDIIYAEGHP